MIFGLGNSSAFPILGIYPHIAGLEVLAEEGFVGALMYLAIIYFAARSVLRIAGRPDLSDFRRNALGVLTGLFVFELVLTQKQGSLLSSFYVWAYAITLARLEAPVPVKTNRPVREKVTASPSLGRFQNLMR
jgi:O-antigen ligase